MPEQAHALGTMVAGNDPAAGVVEADGRAHDMQGGWVADGSMLPRCSRVNPALTL
jgi:choline dehydrogenase-like flavoprotein